MDFLGFSNSDFDFFKKKNSMEKAEFDEKREEVKRHFREFCYQIQKYYYSTTDKTLLLDKDFQGLNKSKNLISAKSNIEGVKFLCLKIEMCQDNISINLLSPPDGDYSKFEMFKKMIADRREQVTKFFKENKSVFMVLYKRNHKKTGDDLLVEEFKFQNNELSLGNLVTLIDDLEKLQPSQYDSKRLGAVNIRIQFSRVDSVKMGKNLSNRVCSDIIRMIEFCNTIKE